MPSQARPLRSGSADKPRPRCTMSPAPMEKSSRTLKDREPVTLWTRQWYPRQSHAPSSSSLSQPLGKQADNRHSQHAHWIGITRNPVDCQAAEPPSPPSPSRHCRTGDAVGIDGVMTPAGLDSQSHPLELELDPCIVNAQLRDVLIDEGHCGGGCDKPNWDHS